MSNAKEDKFLCPLPWVSLCIHTDGKQKVCCHTDVPHHIAHTEEKPAQFLDQEAMDDPLNNSGLVEIRNLMLSGKIPKECLKCHDLEQKGSNSPRLDALEHYKEKFERNLENTEASGLLKKDYNLSFLDLSLGNKCNLACHSCHPYYSSGVERNWRGGPFKVDPQKFKDIVDFTKQEKAWPNFKFDFDKIFFQGGEPLLEKDHVQFLKDLIADKKASEIDLIYNTNLTVFNEKITELWAQFKSIKLDISLDGVERDQEVIRTPLIWSKFLKNLETYKSLSNIEIEFVSVVQVLNIFKFDKIVQFSIAHSSSGNAPSLNFLENPKYLAVESMSEADKAHALSFYENLISLGASKPKELQAYKEIHNYLNNSQANQADTFDLYLFLKKLQKDQDWSWR